MACAPTTRSRREQRRTLTVTYLLSQARCHLPRPRTAAEFAPTRRHRDPSIPAPSPPASASERSGKLLGSTFSASPTSRRRGRSWEGDTGTRKANTAKRGEREREGGGGGHFVLRKCCVGKRLTRSPTVSLFPIRDMKGNSFGFDLSCLVFDVCVQQQREWNKTAAWSRLAHPISRTTLVASDSFAARR